MNRARIGYKIFSTFGILIVFPVIVLSIALSRISTGVESSRLEDRFEYARVFLGTAIADRMQYVAARTRQAAGDGRLASAESDRLAILAAAYGLDGIMVQPAGLQPESFVVESVPPCFDRAFRTTPPEPMAAVVDARGIRVFAAVDAGPGGIIAGMGSVARSDLEVLEAALGVDFDIASLDGDDTVDLTTRRDAYGRNLAGSPFQPVPDGPLAGVPRQVRRTENGVTRLVRPVELPPPLSGRYRATVSLPDSAGVISETSAYIGAFTVATIILAAAASYLMSRQIVAPLQTLLAGVDGFTGRIESGRRFEPLAVPGTDEIGELTESFNRMGRKLGEAYATLREQNLELRELDKVRDEFLAETSQELRTPLNGMISLADGMLMSPGLPENDRRTVRLLARTGRKLYTMIDDILDYSRLAHDDIRLAPRAFELKPLADVVVRFCHGVKRPEVELYNLIEGDRIVYADESRIEQVLYNLVGNAVKYTARGSIILRSSEEGGAIKVSISDTGPGIPPDQLEAVFAPFGQVEDSASDGESGSGLGLTIARRLVELHGGTLTVESTPGQGSTFAFTIPDGVPEGTVMAAPPEPPPEEDLAELEAFDETEHAPGDGSPRYLVLAVDDDPLDLRVLVNGLQDRYDIVTATDGAEALRKLATETRKPDIVLLDMTLPKVSGFEVCSMIRKEYPAEILPVVLITARARPEDVSRAFGAGANDYVCKPLSIPELRARVGTHVELSKVTEAYARFVPRAFLSLLGRKSILEAGLGDYAEGTYTVLVSDIRGFNRLSGRLGARDTFRSLNAFLSRMGPAIRRHDGFIDEYLGDAILAVFPGSPSDAVAAAFDMRREMAAFNAERLEAGEEPMEAGIGIHAGRLMLGTIGESTRMDGTIVSETVNAAIELEDLTAPYGADIIASGPVLESTGESPGTMAARYLGTVSWKGGDEPLPFYELIDETAGPGAARKAAMRHRFERAVFLFESGDLYEAYAAFEELAAELPDDPARQIYIERIRAARGV